MQPELLHRLEKIAKQQNRSLDQLLSDFADDIERTQFRGNPYKLLDQSPALITVSDWEGNFLYINDAFCNALSYERSTLLAQFTSFIHPDDLEETIATGQRLESGESLAQFENRYRHADGSYRWFSWTAIPDQDYIYSIAFDITKQKKNEHKLQQSEQYYRGLIESQIDFVCRYTPDTVLTFVNDAYCRHFEKNRDELIGTSFLSLSEDIATEAIYARIEQVLQNPSPDVRTYHSYDSLGHPKWIQWVDYGILDNDGNVIEIQAIGRDVTELMNAKESLAESEIMLSTIFRNIPVMLAQFDASGSFEYVNKHWVDVLGWTVPEMQNHSDIMSAFYPDPEYRQKALDYMLEAAPGWREFETHTKGGEVVHTSWANVRLPDGRSLGIGVDLSERVKIEEALRESEEQYRNLVETAHDLIWSVTADGKITYINQASEQIYGYTPDEMIGRYYQDFVPEEQMEANNASWRIAIENNDRIFNFENWVQNRDGDRILLNTNVVLSRDREGNIIGSMGTAQNITHRHDLENQRLYTAKLELEIEKEREIQKTKDRFVSLVSHEFRTPLAVMQTSTSLITRYFDRLPKEQVVKKLETISKQIERMVNLMEDTLRYTKTSAGRAEFQPETIDLMPFLRDVIDPLRIIDQNKHTIVLEGEDGTIEADVKLLDHIVSNLLSNALKYSPENSIVTISAEQHPHGWRIMVIDKGIGIPKEDLANLFEPFHRASNALGETGTGLGLSIVREYIGLHGGSIDVSSQIGVGTTVAIQL